MSRGAFCENEANHQYEPKSVLVVGISCFFLEDGWRVAMVTIINSWFIGRAAANDRKAIGGGHHCHCFLEDLYVGRCVELLLQKI